MKMNAGIWVAILGGFVGLGAALFAASTAGNMGGMISLIILGFFGIMFLVFYKLLIGPMLNAKRLSKVGLPGKARILAVKDTGITINNNPVAKLEVEVKDNLGQRYTTSLKVLVSRINPMAYLPGMEIAVKIDPDKKENVVIDTNASASGSVSAEAIKTDLEKLQEENTALSISGMPARAIIKKYNWLGTYVNGNNPYVELELEVLPENSASFSARAKGVIAEASVYKYQPGCEIMVKYDRYDNSKVVIDHS